MSNSTLPNTTPSTQPRFSIRFTARDLVSVALFAVIMVVVTYVIGMVGVVSPLVWIISIPVSVLVNGVVFMLFATRVKHAGMVTLLGVVLALFTLMIGNSILSTLGIIVVAVCADAVLWIANYQSRWAAICAYTVLSLAFFSPFLPFIVDRENYLNSASFASMGEEYVADADALITLPVLGALALVIVIVGFLGGVLGSAMLRKHFQRAGLA